MDYRLIVNVVEELQAVLAGARVSKIYQPDEHLVILKLWNGKETLRLLLSAASSNYRIHLTDEDFLNPSLPPRFCQLLRARVSSVLSFNVVGEDRIVRIKCSGKQGDCTLYIELIGAAANMVLCSNDGIIIDSLKRIDGGGRGVTRLPGIEYELPQRPPIIGNESLEGGIDSGQYGSWNRYVEKFYIDKIKTGSKRDLKETLIATTGKHIRKLAKRIKNIETDLSHQKDFGQSKNYGDLLLANLHLVKKGMKVVALDNYYVDPCEQVDIKLEPLLSPQENAKKYFQKYKKYKAGVEHSRRRLEETQAELDWISQIEYQLNDDIGKADIEDIAEELRVAGLLREQNQLHNRRTQQASQPFESVSPSGFKVLWGRNNRQNDYLSTKVLKKGDKWFHAHLVPGAHVVLKAEGRGDSITEQDLFYAASIAAGYSKRRNDGRVDVMVAESDSVKKPKNSRPGLVTVTSFKALSVEPRRIENQKKKN